MGERLVRASVHDDNGDGQFIGYAWGVYEEENVSGVAGNFLMLYTSSKRVKDEFDWCGDESLQGKELETIIDVDECWTPSVVFVKYAQRALLGENEDVDG